MSTVSPALTIADAHGDAEIAVVRDLFREYETELGIDLCFQGFAQELASLPGEYAPPGGRLLLARAGAEPGSAGGAPGGAPNAGRIAGCVALRRIDAETCEMKRLYLRPEFRGGGAGRQLANACIDAARALGYARLRLDTLPVMRAAISLYDSLGFVAIAPYRPNPIAGALYMQLDLSRTSR